MGAGRIRWDSLLPEQLLHSAVFEDVALSVRITLKAGRGEKKKGKKKAVCPESNSSAPRPRAVSVQV